jgi:hypothetical protein
VAARGPEDRALAILALAMVVAAALLLWLGRGTTYIYDEWDFWARPATPAALLAPDNGNLTAIPIAIYRVVIGLWGDAYLPLRLIEVGLLLTAALLFFVLLSAGERARSWLALGPAVLLLVFGASWDVVAIPLGMTVLSGLCFGLGALIAIQRNTVRGDLLAFALLCAGVAAHTTAAPFACAVAAIVIADGGPRRGRRLLVPAIPLLAFAAYHWHYRDFPTIDGAKLTVAHLLQAPVSLLDSWRAVLGSFASHAAPELSRGVGLALLGLAALAVACRLRMPQRVDRRALAFAVALVTYWLLVAVVGKDPVASRYQAVSALLLVAIAIELIAGLPIRRPLAVLAVTALALAVSLNAAELVRKSRNLVYVNAELNRAKLAAAAIIRDRLPPDFGLQRLADPEAERFSDIFVIDAGEYYEAASLYGSPALSEAELRVADERQRAAADRLLFNGLQLPDRMRPTPLAGCRPAVRRGTSWAIASGPLAGGGLGVRAGASPVRARMRRFAGASTANPPRFGARSERWLAIPSDHSPVPWKAALVSRDPFRLCLRRARQASAPAGGRLAST